MTFEFVAPTRIIFGAGSLASSGSVVAALGQRARVVVGSRTLERAGIVRRLIEHLAVAGIEASERAVEGEPDVACVERGARSARDQAYGVVVGIGGRSALDAAIGYARQPPILGSGDEPRIGGWLNQSDQ